ncbi:hypothetical protein C2G38_2213291 [Gigaspora rosea]|uniref:Uncharacterized protein n=1 Tax=Gigaspora rosea TaxID=44941 RepID=A0A397UFG3_9GLOM|nr:hypothetical protein C2G38_2213291 [Gigaspora rosea]
MNLYNSVLVDAELIEANKKNKFILLYSCSYNQYWGFRTVNDNAWLDELTMHSYNIRLKKKCSVHSIKDIVLVDLQKNSLYMMKEYIKVINMVTKVPSISIY